VKQNTTRKLLLGAVVLVCLMVYLYALTHASHGTSVVGPKLSQHAISQKMYHAPHPSVVRPVAQPVKVATSQTAPQPTPRQQPTVVPTPKMPDTLVNTGAGNPMVVVSVVTICATIFAYAVRLRKLRTRLW
jgi:hypothetical protein